MQARIMYRNEELMRELTKKIKEALNPKEESESTESSENDGEES